MLALQIDRGTENGANCFWRWEKALMKETITVTLRLRIELLAGIVKLCNENAILEASYPMGHPMRLTLSNAVEVGLESVLAATVAEGERPEFAGAPGAAFDYLKSLGLPRPEKLASQTKRELLDANLDGGIAEHVAHLERFNANIGAVGGVVNRIDSLPTNVVNWIEAKQQAASCESSFEERNSQ